MKNLPNPVHWFEIPVLDMKRARQFYETVLDASLQPRDMDPWEMAFFPMTEGAAGTTGCLVKSAGYTPSHAGTLVYFSIADIEETLATVQAHGGKTITPKTSIGEHGFIAHFQDSEGNRVGLHAYR